MRLLEGYCTKIWNVAYTNSEKRSHTKTLTPSIPHRMTETLWPNHVLTRFLTNQAVSAHTSVKGKRRPLHYAAALKRLNKQPNIS